MYPNVTEIRALNAEHAIRDLLSLLSLSSVWIGRDGAFVLEQMLEAVERLVAFDFAVVEVPVIPGEAVSFFGRLPGRALAEPLQTEWRHAVAKWESSGAGNSASARTLPSPIGDIRAIKLDLAMNSSPGRVWFASKAEVFPSNTELAVLRAAVSLGAMGLQAARAQYEKELANRQKDEFLALLGHELRNPLAPIRSTAALLRHEGVTFDQVRLAGEVVERQVRHMTALVDDLLDVSRLSTGSIVLDRTVVDLHEVLEQAIEQVKPALAVNQHEFATQVPDERICVHGDYHRLVQIVCNLLSNAAKYTPPKGRIQLKVSTGSGQMQITVSDNGVGIEPELLPKIFGLFMQVHRSPDRSNGGLGVGLALTKRLVELHDGKLLATSDGLGRGASFTVILPQAVEMDSSSPNSDGHTLQSQQSLRVMVVDDNVDAADTLAAMLEALGHEAHTSYDPKDVLARAAEVCPDVFVLDIGLPHMDGYMLAKRLQQLAGMQPFKLVALTGFGLPDDKGDAEQAGFDFHCVKPVEIAQLQSILSTIASMKSKT